jgi:hypothetical protein
MIPSVNLSSDVAKFETNISISLLQVRGKSTKVWLTRQLIIESIIFTETRTLVDLLESYSTTVKYVARVNGVVNVYFKGTLPPVYTPLPPVTSTTASTPPIKTTPFPPSTTTPSIPQIPTTPTTPTDPEEVHNVSGQVTKYVSPNVFTAATNVQVIISSTNLAEDVKLNTDTNGEFSLRVPTDGYYSLIAISPTETLTNSARIFIEVKNGQVITGPIVLVLEPVGH